MALTLFLRRRRFDGNDAHFHLYRLFPSAECDAFDRRYIPVIAPPRERHVPVQWNHVVGRIEQQVAEMMRDTKFGDRFAFVEDYDINVGRHLVQGVDVWLNNPRRPLEASGTSGQKVVLNGGLNLSVLDGWWAEAYDGLNGFAIGKGRTHSNMDVHDSRDGEDLYLTLLDEVIPLYYDRDRDGLPRGWIKRMKRTIRTLGWRFCADRMVMDYVLKCYIPAAGGTSSDMTAKW